MSHYFDDEPAPPSAPATVPVDIAGLRFEMDTDRGVFSHGQLDSGTAVLLRSVPAPPDNGRLVDVGCGAGAIALTLAQVAPGADVVAVDVNRRARELCAANAARLGLGNLSVIHPDEYPDDRPIDLIWSNPPIRIGKAALHELLTTWLARLSPDGEAFWVVHKHLGADSLHRWLNDSGWPTSRHGSSKGFRVLRTRASGST